MQWTIVRSFHLAVTKLSKNEHFADLKKKHNGCDIKRGTEAWILINKK